MGVLGLEARREGEMRCTGADVWADRVSARCLFGESAYG